MNLLKVFQIRFSIILTLFILLVGSCTLIIIPNSLAQEDTQIPNWIKDVAGWWANDEISENEFLTGIEYLINNNIISISYVPCSIGNQTTSSENLVPNWIKNNAKWWSEDLITDVDFTNGLEYLVENQIIKIDNERIQSQVSIEHVNFSPVWATDKSDLAFISSAFFEIYGQTAACLYDDGDILRWSSAVLGLNPNKIEQYNEVAVWDDTQRSAVVFPYFTYSAYAEPGFYTFYRGECDECTTTDLVQPKPLFTSSGMGHQALTLLGYTSLTDIDIDNNPDVLQQFDKIVMLHSEYVTRAMFDAITSHPNVVYLYPNALYAEIEVNYTDNTITLIRGHNYPSPEISNGFDWEFDNTHPYEYDTDCLGMEFYQIENGWMTTCYPENIFMADGKQIFHMLKVII